MEYVFGTEGEIEVLKTKGDTHTDLTGYQQVVQEYPGEKITDNFRVRNRPALPHHRQVRACGGAGGGH